MTSARYDWSAIVFDLERAGLSQRQIADRCDVYGHSWVNALKNIEGTQPKFHEGAMLLGLWAEVMQLEVSQAPKAA